MSLLDSMPAIVRSAATHLHLQIRQDDRGVVHSSPQCPAAGELPLVEQDLRRFLTAPSCTVCLPLRHAVRIDGPATSAALARLALRLADLRDMLSDARRSDPVALANAGIVAAAAQTALGDLERSCYGITGGPTAASTHAVLLRQDLRSLELLRSAHHGALNREVLRRWVLGPDGPGDDPAGLDERTRRALRWAVRNGADPHRAAAAVGRQPRAAVGRWLEQLDARTAEAAEGPEHVIAVVPAAAYSSGSRAAMLAALGFPVTGDAQPSSRAVPRRLARALVPGFPGVLIADAGPQHPGDPPGALTTFIRLWQPGSYGPLRDAAAALNAARSVLAVTADA